VFDLRVEIIPAPTGPSDRCARYSYTSAESRASGKGYRLAAKRLLLKLISQESLIDRINRESASFGWDSSTGTWAGVKSGPGDMKPAKNLNGCDICGEDVGEYGGNNHAPLAGDKCCDPCNKSKVIPARMALPEGFTYSTPGPCQDCGTEPVWMKNFERWSVVDNLCENCSTARCAKCDCFFSYEDNCHKGFYDKTGDARICEGCWEEEQK